MFYVHINFILLPLFVVKPATITQTAAIIAANPSTNPTNIQIRAPLVSKQPPEKPVSPLIYLKLTIMNYFAYM